MELETTLSALPKQMLLEAITLHTTELVTKPVISMFAAVTMELSVTLSVVMLTIMVFATI